MVSGPVNIGWQSSQYGRRQPDRVERPPDRLLVNAILAKADELRAQGYTLRQSLEIGAARENRRMEWPVGLWRP